MRLASVARRSAVLLLGLGMAVRIANPLLSVAQQDAKDQEVTDDLVRRVKVKVQPIYPPMARRMSIAGTVKLAVVVAANGRVKSSTPVGGHPVLVSAAEEAMKKWKFEPAATESSGVVEFKFQPQ